VYVFQALSPKTWNQNRTFYLLLYNLYFLTYDCQLPEDIMHGQSKPVQPGAHGQNIICLHTLSTKTSFIPLSDNIATEHCSNSTHCLTDYKKIYYHFHTAMWPSHKSLLVSSSPFLPRAQTHAHNIVDKFFLCMFATIWLQHLWLWYNMARTAFDVAWKQGRNHGMYYNYSSMFTAKSFFDNGMVFWYINEWKIANGKALEQTSIHALILHHIQSQNFRNHN
jgi:hypothetical protein